MNDIQKFLHGKPFCVLDKKLDLEVVVVHFSHDDDDRNYLVFCRGGHPYANLCLSIKELDSFFRRFEFIGWL